MSPFRCSMVAMAREEAMATPGYDYDKDIPASFYDEIHQRRAGVRFFWHDLKFRAVAARLDEVGKVLDVGCGPGTFIELIEHLPPADTSRLLAEARGLLSPQGRLVVTTPNYRSLWPLIEWGVNRVSRVNYEQQHINKYRRGPLAADLAQAGYAQVEVGTAVGLAPFAAVLGQRPARWLDAVERGIGHLGCGNLLIAVARP